MDPALRSRRRFVLPSLALLAVLVAAGLALFQPWKAWIDDVVDEAAPVASPSATGASTIPTAAPTSAPSATTAPTSAPSAAPAAPATTVPATTVPATTVPATTVSPTTGPAAPPAPVEPAPTSFRSKAHGTSGFVRLLTLDDGSRVLRIEDLDTSNGPDVKVVLSADPDGYAGDGAVSLGTLKGNKGSQNYEIPADVDLSSLRSVVIWCKRFDVDFGVAGLPGAPA